MLIGRKLFYWIIVLICVLCGCYNLRMLPNGGVRPIWPCFKLANKPFQLKDNVLIDTNAIYVSKKKNDWEGFRAAYHPTADEINHNERWSADTNYTFLRFFSNGRVMIQGIFHIPNNHDINNLDCTIGYYRLDSNSITLELFDRGYGGAFIMFFGQIRNDTLIFYKTINNVMQQTGPLELKEVYCKEKDPVMRFISKPDW